MGKIRELIKNFINPIEPPKSFDELAVAAGIGAEERAILKKTMGGVNWKFDEGIEETKKVGKTRISSNQPPIQSKTKTVVAEQEKGFDR